MSIVYFIGEVIVTLTSIKPLGAPNLAGPLIGLFIISIGTGGIKPCVGAFGANQFKPTQKRYIDTFFSVFYLSINVGSTIGTILTPIFRNDVKCFGDDCFPLAFGVPAIFMFIAILFFIAGTKFYKKEAKKNIRDNIIVKTGQCIYKGVVNKIKYRKTIKKAHWLDYAEDEFDSQTLSDVKAFCKVLVVLLPLPIYWTLYDQQGSRWTEQAQQLNGRIGSFTIKPDQFQAVNPILIVLLVPVFDILIYPLLTKFNLLKRYLQRISVGLVLTILSFVIAAILEARMESSWNTLNPSNRIRFVNLSPCNLTFTNNGKDLFDLQKAEYLNNNPINLPDGLYDELFKEKEQALLEIRAECDNSNPFKTDFNLQKKDVLKTFFFSQSGSELEYQHVSYSLSERIIGSGQMRFLNFKIDEKELLKPELISNSITYNNFTVEKVENFSNSKYQKIDYGDFKFKVGFNNQKRINETNLLVETCGCYTVILFLNPKNSQLDFVKLTDVYQNGVHLGWQLIQIFVVSLGEIMFSISGISFAYSQAPASMKSVMQSLWYMTIAVGNLIVIIVAESRFIKSQVFEYVFFAGLLGLATIVFLVLSYFYKYADETSQDGNNKVAPMLDEKPKEKYDELQN